MPTHPAPPKQKTTLGRIWMGSPSCYTATSVLADLHGVHQTHWRSASVSSAPVEGVFGVNVVKSRAKTQDSRPELGKQGYLFNGHSPAYP
jgi:hypothetical protein